MDESLIKKSVIYPGTKKVGFQNGTKVKFHFVAKTCGENSTTLDDSRTMKNPMELILGKKFKLEVWEAVVQTMMINEVSSFVVDKSLTSAYPFISKTLRDIGKPKSEIRSHCCGSVLNTEGVGYNDLNQLMKEPADLEFIIELLSVEQPEEYKKESWQMDDDEKIKAIPEIKQQGNEFYKNKQFKDAADKYALALGMLEQLMIKEKPGDVEWTDLNNIKLPILLNFAQCKLLNEEYYAVIEHCTTVLKCDQTNVKALYRRGKAHVGAWNPEEARKDLEKALELDKSLTKLINKDLKDLDLKLKEKDLEDKRKLEGKMF